MSQSINTIARLACLLTVLFLPVATMAGEAGTSSSIEATPAPDIQRIIDRGTLIVSMYHRDTPPFYFRNENGKMAGFDVDLIKKFAKKLGVGVRFNRAAKSFDEVANAVARREADLAISKLSRTFPRSLRVRYTTPYLVLHQGLLINRLELARQARGAPAEKAIRNLHGKIGVIGSSSYEGFARTRFPNATVVGFPTWNEVVNAAAEGKIVAAYRDELEIKKIIRSKADNLIKFQTVILMDTRDPIAIAVNWRDTNLLALLETYLDDLELNLSADVILNKYKDMFEQKPK